MADRRMFSKTIIDSDAFLDMPLSSQALYFHLSMRADDEGFINNPKKIQRMIGASDDDLKILIGKNFLIPFESGIVVVKHWRIHNYIQSDRFKKTVYTEEREQLTVKDNKAYTLNNQPCIQDGYTMDTQVRLGKVSLDKDSIDKDTCSEPSKKPMASKPDGTDSEHAFIDIPTNTGEPYYVSVEEVAEYKSLYPAVDVEQELRNMKGWSLSNASKRKTRKGMKRFINSWLAREQDRGGSRSSAPSSNTDRFAQFAQNRGGGS